MTRLPLLERLGQRPENFPGALLLCGAAPEPLREEAFRLAARLLCPEEDPNLECSSCRRVFAGLHPDLFPVEAEGVGIRVDRIREALAFGAGRPYEAARRVAIVSRAELLGLEAGNALLKALEEPGKHLHWILTTTRPEALLPTILSRCAMAPIPSPSRGQKRAVWRERGFSAEDAEDLILAEPKIEDAAESLESYRQIRLEVAAALEAGFLSGRVAPLILLADRLARGEEAAARLLSELLADAAISSAASADLLRHPAVAGVTREVGRRLPVSALVRGALTAADAPPDLRRGNRRLHYERVLMELYLESRK
jgi:hypothetical protein